MLAPELMARCCRSGLVCTAGNSDGTKGFGSREADETLTSQKCRRALFALALALTPAATGQTPPEWSAVSMALMMRSCTAQACVYTYER